jgi:type II secretory pathway component PulJ
MPYASPALMTRLRALAAELNQLDRDLQRHGDREVGDIVKRARRELELGIRQGQFQSRGVNV